MDWGLACAGLEHAWFCESSEPCRDRLAVRWPGVRIYDDVRAVDARAGRVDIVAGGFPCQPISDAGKKLAQADARWLWPEFARVVRDLRPRYVIVENVPALTRRGLGIVLGDLALLGFDAEWDVLPAVAFGAAHLRKRLFLVAYPDTFGRDGWSGIFPEAPWRAELEDCGSRVQDPDGVAVDSWGLWRRTAQAGGKEWWPVEPDMGRVAHGVPDRLDRLAALGNGVVPQVAQWVAERIVEREAVRQAAA